MKYVLMYLISLIVLGYILKELHKFFKQIRNEQKNKKIDIDDIEQNKKDLQYDRAETGNGTSIK